MYIASGQLLSDVTLLADFAYALVLFQALRTAPWRRFRDWEQLNLFLVACASLLILWNLRAGVSPGLVMHYLGITAMTLTFGWQFAVIAAGLALVGIGFVVETDWSAFAVNALIIGVVPAMVTQALYRWIDRKLPNHFFIYIYLCAFLAGALGILASALFVIGLLSISGAYEMDKIVYEYVAYLPLLVFPEAVLNGMVMTALVVLKPQWVCSFDDERYIRNK